MAWRRNTPQCGESSTFAIPVENCEDFHANLKIYRDCHTYFEICVDFHATMTTSWVKFSLLTSYPPNLNALELRSEGVKETFQVKFLN